MSFEHEQETEAIAILSPLRSGNLHDCPSERPDVQSASHAAWTLAWLETAMATLPAIPSSDGSTPLPTFGEFAHWHPLVPDPLAGVERLPADREQANQLRACFPEGIESVPRLSAALPHQVLPRDSDPGNLLMDPQRVTAGFDFACAGRARRVLELGVALSWWPVHVLGTGQEWKLIDVFGSASTRQMALSTEEWLALPAVFRLRDATSLVHRTGRSLARMETEARMQRRVEPSLWREAWLSAHHHPLRDHALAWT